MADRDAIDPLAVVWWSLGGTILSQLASPAAFPAARAVQVAARIAVWFVGGIILFLCMRLTAMALGRLGRWPGSWVGGVAFIGIELIVHLALQVRGRPSFYNGRG